MKIYFKCAIYFVSVMAYSFILLPYLFSQPSDAAVAVGIAAIIVELPLCFIGAKNIWKDIEDKV